MAQLIGTGCDAQANEGESNDDYRANKTVHNRINAELIYQIIRCINPSTILHKDGKLTTNTLKRANFLNFNEDCVEEKVYR